MKDTDRFKQMMDERRELERSLLERIKQAKPQLESTLDRMSAHWTYEDFVYRFYHGSFKVYGVQSVTEDGVRLLQSLLPGRAMNSAFATIVAEGTGHSFEPAHNADWSRHTRPQLEAFFHTKFMIEMAIRYSGLDEPPNLLPSGWAALLYLFDLR